MIYCELLVILMGVCSIVGSLVIFYWITLIESKQLKILSLISGFGFFSWGYIDFIGRFIRIIDGNKSRTQVSSITEAIDFYIQYIYFAESSFLYSIHQSPWFTLMIFSVLFVFPLIIVINLKFIKIYTVRNRR